MDSEPSEREAEELGPEREQATEAEVTKEKSE